MGTNPVLFWVAALVGVYPLSAFLLVSLGQPVRPVGHLLKASGFWTLIIWVILAVAMVALSTTPR